MHNGKLYAASDLVSQSPFGGVLVERKISDHFVHGCCVRVCIHFSGFAELGVLSVVCRSTTHAARMRTQFVSQAATEVPVLQIWSDQSPQP